jgi:hypothetical protein
MPNLRWNGNHMELSEVKGNLEKGEIHPSSHIAMKYIRKKFNDGNIAELMEPLASSALSGNRMAEIVHETLRRVYYGEPVSDRYLMGAMIFLWEMNEEKHHLSN